MARYDLNDARVDALRIATDGGLSLEDFNKIWVLLIQRPWNRTERVRNSYICKHESIYGIEHDRAEFDRWLAEVKAQAVAEFIDETGVSLDAARSLMAKAWEEGYAAGDADAHTKDRLDRYNPYINRKTP